MSYSSFASKTRVFIGALCFAASSFVFAAPTVEVETNMGKIVIELDQAAAPKTVANFMKYVSSGFYNGTIFHRVIDGFMVQGGGFNKAMSERPTQGNVENEAKNELKNLRGTIAMARRGEPHSASAQFFINLKDNDFLNYVSDKSPQTWGYAVFGKVTSGMEIVDKIAKVPTETKGMFENVPKEAVSILSVKVKP